MNRQFLILTCFIVFIFDRINFNFFPSQCDNTFLTVIAAVAKWTCTFRRSALLAYSTILARIVTTGVYNSSVEELLMLRFTFDIEFFDAIGRCHHIWEHRNTLSRFKSSN